MQRGDQKYRHHRDERDALQDAQRARLLLFDVLQVQCKRHQPGADDQPGKVTEARRHGKARRAGATTSGNCSGYTIMDIFLPAFERDGVSLPKFLHCLHDYRDPPYFAR